MKKKFITFFCILILSFTAYGDQSLVQINQKLKKIERDITDLQKTVFTKIDKQISNDTENAISKITVFDMRLRDIENELHAINLNYENISFEIEDLKKSLEELSLKFNNTILELNNAIITINSTMDDKLSISSENTNILELEDSDEITESQNEENNILGTLKISSADSSESKNLNETNETDEKDIFLSPEEQFQSALDNLRSQKYEEAKSNFELFIKDHPSNVLLGSAHYWLGELYLLQKEFLEAALVFAEGYQKYPDSIKSPNMLYKLAETYIKIKKINEACRTFNQFILKFPDNQLIDKAKSKMNEIQCS